MAERAHRGNLLDLCFRTEDGLDPFIADPGLWDEDRVSAKLCPLSCLCADEARVCVSCDGRRFVKAVGSDKLMTFINLTSSSIPSKTLFR